jgi:ferrous iron transport protein B
MYAGTFGEDICIAEIKDQYYNMREKVEPMMFIVDLAEKAMRELGIEPIIKPLGYDWKIGIALITSFAAREVFVGTMATLYSVEEDNNSSLREKLRASVWPDGKPVYNLATALSLMVFYVLAMQCMSTLAIVKRETGTWKWPTIQFVMMTGLAYLLSWLTYVIAK